MNKWNILNTAEVINGKVFVNGKLDCQVEGDFIFASKELYKKYCKANIKFFKMDSLSKLGYLTAELLLKNFSTDSIDLNEVAMVVGNSNATKDTDMKYFKTIHDQPSPAVFVYTLPNILLGEICIKYGFKGQNIFYISEKFDESELLENVNLLINNSTSEYVICGWVDYINETNYYTVLFLIGKDSKSANFALENLKQLNHINS